MKKLTIIHLRAAEFFGGPERAIIGQCRHLPDIDFVCAAFVRDDKPNEFLIRSGEAGFKTEIIKDRFAGDYGVVSQIRQILSKHHADILVTHDYKANFFGRQAVKNTRAQHISHFRGYTSEDKKVRLYNAINAWLLKKIPVVLTVSEKSKQFLIERGVQSDKVHVIPNAIEESQLLPEDFKRSIPQDGPIKLICAGRLSFEKGYDILLKALATIKDKAPDFTVSIYGHGPEKENLEKITTTLNLESHVRWFGFTDDILSALNDSDLLILPSRSEGMPNVLLEAWSQKLGVVSTAVGGVPEMMAHYQAGWLAESENPADLGQKILEALSIPDEIIKRGESGYRTVRDIYSYKNQAALLKKLYFEIAGINLD